MLFYKMLFDISLIIILICVILDNEVDIESIEALEKELQESTTPSQAEELVSVEQKIIRAKFQKELFNLKEDKKNKESKQSKKIRL